MHLLSATHCEVTGAPAIEGFDAEQERRLRSRKKVPGVDSEEDKWRQVFLILFPDCIEIPSSCELPQTPRQERRRTFADYKHTT